MAVHFQSVSSSTNYTAAFQRLKSDEETKEIEINPAANQDEYNQLFCIEELDLALSSCSGSSPGPDHIHYDMLKNLSKLSKDALLQMYNNVWTSQEFPVTWKEATVIPILKKGKDPLDANSYRPISLTSCLCKVYERMINGRLVFHLEAKNLLSPRQWGFRKNKSTEDVLAILSTEICDAFRTKESIVLTSLDLSKAYDMCWRYGIVKLLKNMPIDGRMLGNVKEFMTNRTLRVAIGAHISDLVTIENGVPQGAVLSVTLFLVALSNIDRDIERPTKTIGYADDWVLYSKAYDVNQAESAMQKALDSIEKWSRQTGFRFSEEKTVVMLFTKRHNERRTLQLHLNGKPLENVPNHRILGLIFDDRLNWNAHIMDVKARATKKLSILKTLATTNWGADRNVMLQIHEMTILATIRYGDISYGSACTTNLEKLDAVHHNGLRLALGVFKVSNNVNVLCEAGSTTLQNMRDTNTMVKAIRISANKKHPLSHRIRFPPFHNFYATRPRMPKPLDIRAKHLFKDINFRPIDVQQDVDQRQAYWTTKRLERIDTSLMTIQKTNSDQRTQAEYLNIVRNKYADHVLIFTDGSLADGRTGCAAILPNETIAKRLTNITSVFNAEQQAIIYALRQVEEQFPENILIVSDSLSCLNAVGQIKVNNNPKTKTIANLMNENENINLLWVPGHKGISGNEEADRAAKESLSFEEPSNTYSTAEDAINFIKRRVWERRQEE
jgi:ribonuclease HI